MVLINLAWQLFLITGAMTLFAFVTFAIRRWPFIGLSIIGLHVVFLFEVPDSFTLVSAGGITVAFLDVVSLAFLIVFATHLKSWGHSSSGKFFFAFSLVVALAAIGGIALHGPNVSLNEARQFIWMIASLMWSSTLDWQSKTFRRRFLYSMLGLGWVLMAAASVHFAFRGFGGYGDNFIDASGDSLERRILSSGQALVLFFCLLSAVSLMRLRRFNLWIFLSVTSFGIVLILSQQRTVWVVAAVVLLVALLIDRRRSLSSYLWAAFLFLTLAIVFATGILDSVAMTLSSSVTNTATFDGRIAGWFALIRQSVESGPWSVVFGQPFGGGWERVEGGRIVSYSPHNWYVSLFLRTGIVGLSVFCIGLILTLASALRDPSSRIFFLFTLSIVVYSWAYNATWYGAILVGATIAISRREPLGGKSLDAVKKTKRSIHSAVKQ
jgi:hypothetical protein